jgi:hypothetical protein
MGHLLKGPIPITMPRGHPTFLSLPQRLICKLGVWDTSRSRDAYQRRAKTNAAIKKIDKKTALTISLPFHRILWSFLFLPLSKVMTFKTTASLQCRNLGSTF